MYTYTIELFFDKFTLTDTVKVSQKDFSLALKKGQHHVVEQFANSVTVTFTGGDGRMFEDEQYAQAQAYHTHLSPEDQRCFWKHYTRGSGAGLVDGVDAETSFEDFLVLSMISDDADKRYDR